jgi:hypothetical protein
MRLIAGFDAVEKRKISCICRELNPGRPDHIPPLYRLSYPGSVNGFLYVNFVFVFCKVGVQCILDCVIYNFFCANARVGCTLLQSRRQSESECKSRAQNYVVQVIIPSLLLLKRPFLKPAEVYPDSGLYALPRSLLNKTFKYKQFLHLPVLI